MHRTISLIAALLSMLFGQAASAEAGIWSKAGGWIIAMDPGDNCSMLRSYNDGWLFGVGFSAERRAIGVVVGKLPYKVGDNPALSWDIGDASYSGGQNVVTKVDSGMRITAAMDSSFVDKLATTPAIEIYDDDEKVVGFKLTEVTAGIAELRRCMGELIKEDKGSRRPAINEAKPGNLSTLITADDYPATAQKASASGRAGIALTITAHGLVSDCAIVASSGNADLDSATCRIMRDRARFTPATDVAGKATEGRYQTGIKWNLPPE